MVYGLFLKRFWRFKAFQAVLSVLYLLSIDCTVWIQGQQGEQIAALAAIFSSLFFQKLDLDPA